MKVHEYQARQLLAEAGVPVPQASVCGNVLEVTEAFDRIKAAGLERAVVKAQVFAGGRGKAGFVRLVTNRTEARDAAQFMLSNRMVSPQTGPDGIAVKKLLVAAAVDIAREFYVAVVLDRVRSCPVVMVSTAGGVDIEEVAHQSPDKVVKVWCDPHLGLLPFQITQLINALGLTEKVQLATARKVITGLVSVFMEKDAILAEINPLVLTRDGQMLAIDAKMTFDDNALFRHPDLQAMIDHAEENPNEARAQASDLAYIAMDGNIGCLVNGAGLAMATMDIVKLHGGQPANFLDVGGSVTKDGAIEAFRIILSDRRVKAVLVNIFGGIARCDLIAEALVAAGKQVGFHVPVVVRLEGNQAARAREMLDGARAELPTLFSANDLTDAAVKVCKAVA